MSESMSPLYFIAGGTGGIGSEVAGRLRAHGSEVALAARNEARLGKRARELGARAVPMDATQPEAVARAFDAVLAKGGRLLGVVNCVGTILLKPAHLTSDEEWRTTLETNLHPLGRLGEPGDIASAICWLLSPEQTWVTGQVLHVDGGLSTVQAR